MNYKFYLKDKNKIESPIYIDIRIPNERSRIPVNIKIKTKNWDNKKQCAKINESNAPSINTKLKNISLAIDKYIIETPKINHNIKSVIDIVKNSDGTNVKNNLDIVNEFIDYLKQDLNSKGSFKKLENLQMIIDKSNPNLRFSNLNLKDIDLFTDYLIKNNYSNSYIIRTTSLLKTTIRKYNQFNPNYDISYLVNHKNKISNKYSTLIALDDNEINLLCEYKPNIRNKKVLDLFIIQCYTGLRISDLLNLKKENIDKTNNEILITTIKTSELIRIPITKKIIPIFEKYNYELPKISDVKYNKYIKEICKDAGIDSPTLITSWKAGNRIDEIKSKYELISSHTARRTFITRLLRKGLLPEQIMKITGHRNRRSFDEYVKITQTEAIDAVRNALD